MAYHSKAYIHLAYTCARLDFDNWLMLQVKKTNIAVLEGIKITAVEQNDDAITLTANSGNKYKTALLIGTDGSYIVDVRFCNTSRCMEWI